MTVPGGRGVAGRLSNRLLPVLVAGVKDSEAEVRNNSVFGLGCLAQAAGPIVVSYPLQRASTRLSITSRRLASPHHSGFFLSFCTQGLSHDALRLLQTAHQGVRPAGDRQPVRRPLQDDHEQHRRRPSGAGVFFNPRMILCMTQRSLVRLKMRRHLSTGRPCPGGTSSAQRGHGGEQDSVQLPGHALHTQSCPGNAQVLLYTIHMF